MKVQKRIERVTNIRLVFESKKNFCLETAMSESWELREIEESRKRNTKI